MQRRRNQNKPTPPLELIEPHIRRMWQARFTDTQIVAELRKHIDTNQYGIGLTKFREIRNAMGLKRTRQQGHTPESIHQVMVKLRATYPDAGIREMISLIFHEHDMAVSRSVMQDYFVTYEPHLIRQRKANRLQRRRFWAAGVNDIWAVDQHDKWLRFGLALHTGIEPFSGRILWMKIWHSNRNPQLILSYYLEAVENFGFIPMVTQSDPGTENFGVANAHTMLRQMHDPTLDGFVQHRWMRVKKNIVPEIAWSQLRKRFTPGFERLLDEGVNAGWYDPDNTLQLMIFRWLFIPWLQKELENYQHRINNTAKRRDRKKVLPHGIPAFIHSCAEDYGALDFKVMVSPESVQYVRELYIKPDHLVFDLLPTRLNQAIQTHYNHLGQPSVERSSIWTIYLTILDGMRQSEEVADLLELAGDDDAGGNELPLLSGLCDLHEVDGYLGGVANGLGMQAEHLRALDMFDDEPDLGGDDGNGIDVGPEVWVDEFSSSEEEDINDIDGSL